MMVEQRREAVGRPRTDRGRVGLVPLSSVQRVRDGGGLCPPPRACVHKACCAAAGCGGRYSECIGREPAARASAWVGAPIPQINDEVFTFRVAHSHVEGKTSSENSRRHMHADSATVFFAESNAYARPSLPLTQGEFSRSPTLTPAPRRCPRPPPALGPRPPPPPWPRAPPCRACPTRRATRAAAARRRGGRARRRRVAGGGRGTP